MHSCRVFSAPSLVVANFPPCQGEDQGEEIDRVGFASAVSSACFVKVAGLRFRCSSCSLGDFWSLVRLRTRRFRGSHTSDLWSKVPDQKLPSTYSCPWIIYNRGLSLYDECSLMINNDHDLSSLLLFPYSFRTPYRICLLSTLKYIT